MYLTDKEWEVVLLMRDAIYDCDEIMEAGYFDSEELEVMKNLGHEAKKGVDNINENNKSR